MPIALTDALRDEYTLLFSRMSVRSERQRQVERISGKIRQKAAKEQYIEVERQTGVPWFVVAIIHSLEASCRFDRHLHNGDPLTGPTTHVPKNRPSARRRKYNWVESAVDALQMRSCAINGRWSVPEIAFVLESFNGFGYRKRYPHVKSPYLWSFSNLYSCGKYVRDGVFSETAVSQQCRGMTLLHHIMSLDEDIFAALSFDPISNDGKDETHSFPLCDGPEGEEVSNNFVDREAPRYPGRYLLYGIEDDEDVRALQQRLVHFGFNPGMIDGDYGEVTERAVRLFQARSADLSGEPLEIDGIVGPNTWGTLFGFDTIKGHEGGPDILQNAYSDLATTVLAIASEEVGVREFPAGSNRGPKVDQYIRAAGLQPEGHYAWCMCFVYWCFDQAAKRLQVANPCPRKAGVHTAWNACRQIANSGGANQLVVLAATAQRDPSRVRPGMVFFIDTGAGTGHVGIVEAHRNGVLETIEGNTNDGGSREGIGVFRRSRRKVSQVNLGFVSFC